MLSDLLAKAGIIMGCLSIYGNRVITGNQFITTLNEFPKVNNDEHDRCCINLAFNHFKVTIKKQKEDEDYRFNTIEVKGPIFTYQYQYMIQQDDSIIIRVDKGYYHFYNTKDGIMCFGNNTIETAMVGRIVHIADEKWQVSTTGMFITEEYYYSHLSSLEQQIAIVLSYLAYGGNNYGNINAPSLYMLSNGKYAIAGSAEGRIISFITTLPNREMLVSLNNRKFSIACQLGELESVFEIDRLDLETNMPINKFTITVGKEFFDQETVVRARKFDVLKGAECDSYFYVEYPSRKRFSAVVI